MKGFKVHHRQLMSLLKKKKKKRHSVFLFIFKGVLLQLPGGYKKRLWSSLTN